MLSGGYRLGFLLCPTPRCAATMPEPIISGMDKPDYVVRGVMRSGDCGTPLRLGVDGWAPCENPGCIRNKLASNKSAMAPERRSVGRPPGRRCRQERVRLSELTPHQPSACQGPGTSWGSPTYRACPPCDGQARKSAAGRCVNQADRQCVGLEPDYGRAIGERSGVGQFRDCQLSHGFLVPHSSAERYWSRATIRQQWRVHPSAHGEATRHRF
jgi:hypothetical protein